jgi:hypothetical protein
MSDEMMKEEINCENNNITQEFPFNNKNKVFFVKTVWVLKRNLFNFYLSLILGVFFVSKKNTRQTT